MAGSFSWHGSSPTLDLRPGEIHVWRIALDAPESAIERLRPLLSPDEAARAARFYFERHRRRFLVCRGAVRSVLGRYLELDPARLAFEYGPHGKPRLAADMGKSLAFNVAHSDDRALLAVTIGREIGVDLERHKEMSERDRIVESVFAGATAREYAELDEPDRPSAFYRAWTRGEAVMKALGDGFSVRVDVTVAPHDPPRVREVVGRPGEAARWSLLDLGVGEGFSAALAIAGESSHPRLINARWDESECRERSAVGFDRWESESAGDLEDVML
jgi:4'-phosphopantetheinyl transferase